MSTDLPALLAGMRPALHAGRHVFVTVPDDDAVPSAARAAAVVVVREAEGTTLVLPESAVPAGARAEYPCAWITLEVASSLAAVGFLAAVTTALAGAGLSVNPVSGFHHDHLFVAWDDRDTAMAVLGEFAAGG